MKVHTILFDLGNVVIDLDEQRLYREFADLAGLSVSEILEKAQKALFFNDLETGSISENEFRDGLRGLLNAAELTDERVDDAWNSILLKIDPALVEMIAKLKAHYQIMVLSNTNSIHARKFHQLLAAVSPYQHLDELFHHVYLSHQIGERKPDLASWQFILDRHPALKPSDILFLDDRSENLEGAKSLGIAVQQIHHPGETMELLRKII